MTDVIELIIADHRRILRLASVVDGAGRASGEIGPDTALASVWNWLANLIEMHIGAEDEICGLALRGSGLDCGSDHEDIRVALREAGISSPGSPDWWRAVGAVNVLCAGHFRREEREALAALRLQTCLQSRRKLADQWRTYIAAQALQQTIGSPSRA
jgi:hypothetical protein